LLSIINKDQKQNIIDEPAAPSHHTLTSNENYIKKTEEPES